MTEPPIERVLFTESQIDARIREVAAEISAKYAGRELKLIGVLKGSIFFLTALARHITVPVRIDLLAISSFGKGAPGVVRIAKDLDDSIEAEDVLLVEDIVDTGLTTRYLLHALSTRRPRSLGPVPAPQFSACSTARMRPRWRARLSKLLSPAGGASTRHWRDQPQWVEASFVTTFSRPSRTVRQFFSYSALCSRSEGFMSPRRLLWDNVTLVPLPSGERSKLTTW